MADEKLELNEDELSGASGGLVAYEDKECVTYTCPNCGGTIKWKKFPKKNAPHTDEGWACDNCYFLFRDSEVSDLPYFITKSF